MTVRSIRVRGIVFAIGITFAVVGGCSINQENRANDEVFSEPLPGSFADLADSVPSVGIGTIVDLLPESVDL